MRFALSGANEKLARAFGALPSPNVPLMFIVRFAAPKLATVSSGANVLFGRGSYCPTGTPANTVVCEAKLI